MIEINLQPDELRLDGRHLATVIDRWLVDVPDRSRYGYSNKIAWFRRWWAEAGPGRQWVIDGAALRAFEAWLRSVESERTGESPGYHTRNDALRRLRQCLHWAHRKGYTAVDCSVLVPTADGAPPLRESLDLSVLRAMLRATDLTPFPLRNRAIVATFAGTGIRLGECAGLDVADVRIDADGTGLLHVRKAKQNRSRLACFDAATGACLRSWLDMRDLPDDERLFGIGRKQLYRVVVEAADLGGVRDRIEGPHDLRRLFVTTWNRNRRGQAYGQLLMKQIGHTNWTTTLRYSLQDTEDVREVFVSPVGLI